MRNLLSLLVALALAQGCDDGTGSRTQDALGPRADAGIWLDSAAAVGDSATADSATLDSTTPDTATPDQGGGIDMDSVEDGTADSGSAGDTSPPDAGLPDAPNLCGNKTLDPGESCDDGVTTQCTTYHDGGDGTCVPPGTCSSGYALDASGNCVKSTTGLTVPCQQGPGWTLFRFHYGGGGTSPSVDVWDASCSYSYAPNSACNVYAVYPGFGSVSYTSQGYPILTTSEYLRVRFSVAGLSFSKAAVYIQARSYATAASTYYEVWSPLYGGLVAGPVDNDWVYDWYGLDWSGYLQPTDQPSLTAIQIYADKGSGHLAVKAVELCVQ